MNNKLTKNDDNDIFVKMGNTTILRIWIYKCGSLEGIGLHDESVISDDFSLLQNCFFGHKYCQKYVINPTVKNNSVFISLAEDTCANVKKTLTRSCPIIWYHEWDVNLHKRQLDHCFFSQWTHFSLTSTIRQPQPWLCAPHTVHQQCTTHCAPAARAHFSWALRPMHRNQQIHITCPKRQSAAAFHSWSMSKS